ncbi:MAG: phytanoyl-CoA dioxygenase family protein [archaeon]|nr:phytanoyl-CoA dioxygenase family protein [archaeon]
MEKGVTSSQQQQAQQQHNQEEPSVLRWHRTGESTVRLHISRHHPITWATQLWPGIPHLGIIQSHGWANGAVAWRNRQLEKLHGVFSALAGTPRLLVTADRYGFMRPTRGEGCHESWATTARWLHWDMNPWDGDWSLYGFDAPTKELPCVRLQGLLNVTEAREEDGGFYTVPGCSHHTLQWASHRPHLRQQYTNHNFVPVPREDTALYPRVQQIPARAGSLIVWNSLQAHSNHPNSSSRPRAVQYLTMVDADVGMTRQLPFEQVLPPAFQPTPLGRKLLSLDPWTPPPDPSIFSSCDII